MSSSCVEGALVSLLAEETGSEWYSSPRVEEDVGDARWKTGRKTEKGVGKRGTAEAEKCVRTFRLGLAIFRGESCQIERKRGKIKIPTGTLFSAFSAAVLT